jgi:hypothetical protein
MYIATAGLHGYLERSLKKDENEYCEITQFSRILEEE